MNRDDSRRAYLYELAHSVDVINIAAANMVNIPLRILMQQSLTLSPWVGPCTAVHSLDRRGIEFGIGEQLTHAGNVACQTCVVQLSSKPMEILVLVVRRH